MIMKKYIVMAMSVALFGMTSCSEDQLDEVNKNYKYPAANVVPAHLQITDAIMATAFHTTSGDYSFYLSSLTEQQVGTGNNQFMKAELRNAGEIAAPSTFDNVWNSTYSNLLNIKEMIDKVEKNIASSGGQLDVLGAAQVLKVINFEILTDMHGDIPYSEALQTSANMQPKSDSQESIYADLVKTIDNAIENLNTATEEEMANFGSEDILFKGNTKKWLALAYAVKARLYIHQTAVNANAAAEALKAADKALELGFAGCYVKEFDGDVAVNPWAAFLDSRGYTAPSKTVVDIMGEKDPRLKHYITATAPNSAYEKYYGYEPGTYGTPGDEDFAKGSWTPNISEYYYMYNEPVQVLSLHELYFIKAEAEARTGKDATKSFKQAVQASITESNSWVGDEETGETYAASLGSATLEKIFVQKYIAMAIDEHIQTYNDLRRCMAMGENYITLTNPKNNQSGLNRWPYLLPYGQGSLVSNPNLKTVDIYAKQCWLFGGK